MLKKSVDYSANRLTPLIPTRKTDITGMVSLNKIVRPKSTIEKIEVKEEKKEFKKVTLR